MKQYQHGLAPDPRTPEQKAKDYPFPSGAIVLEWIEKPTTDWKKYEPREQAWSLSCMAQAGAKAMRTLGFDILSAHPPYRSRANYPNGGMYTQNLGDVYKTIGTTLESIDQSQNQDENLLNRKIAVDTPLKSGGYFFPKISIDEAAEAIAIHKHCILVVHANKEEWTSIPKYNGKEIDFGHGICGVDYFLNDGVKTILLEDSTGHFNSFDKNGQRLITEDFFNKRVVGLIVFVKDITELPYTFYKVLKMGIKNSFDTKMLQAKLNKVYNASLVVDGNFGFKTKAAVVNFQILHHLKADGVAGKLTNVELNKI